MRKKPLSAWWFLSYAVIIVATFVAAVLQYPYLPDQIPMHYNIAGEVDRYVAKSIATFSDMPIMQLIIGLLFVGIYFAILRAKTQSNGGDTEEGLKRDRRFKTIMANFIFFIGFTVMLIFGFVQFSMLGLISISLMSVFTIVFLVVVFAFLVFLITRVGQGGNRMRGNKTSGQTTVTDDDSNWIFGFLYCNKNDPSLFVEKRYGMGYTINFGSPISWVVIIAFVALIAALVILPFVLH